MTGTPKSLRQPPQRRFENYTLTRVIAPDVGVSSVQPSLFTQVSGSVGQGGTSAAISSPLPIGFDFQIDNITYSKFVVSTAGWLALVDPNFGTFSITDISTGFLSENATLRSTFTRQHVLLAPWFDNIVNLTSDVSQITSYGATKKLRVQTGLETPEPIFNEAEYAVRYYVDEHSNLGRRLLVRWSSQRAGNVTMLKFEVALYENGTIEFRYDSKAKITTSDASDGSSATVGIFMPNGTNRFRDFSLGLGYRDGERQQYKYGGAVYDASYTDTSGAFTAAYTVNLTTFQYWPGTSTSGAVFTFAPPLNRRKILPRQDIRSIASVNNLPTVARTGDKSRPGNKALTFDDRRSVNYSSGVVVNYPTTLPRFYGDSSRGANERQNLFSGDFEITASTVSQVIDTFIAQNVIERLASFNENKVFDDPSDVFFSGSSIDDLGLGLNQDLRDKTQVRLELPVQYNMKMFETSSSIYYYNKRSACWEVPNNSSYAISNLATTNNSGISKGDIAKPSVDSPNRRIIEDVRGFGPIGNAIASGSSTRSTVGDQTDSSISSSYTRENVTVAMNKLYAKSVSNNEDYKATTDETFTIPINHPFLVEKAVIEIPMAAGHGWFQDQTTCFEPLETTSGSFDFAGPALTLALFNQVTLGSTTRRDLVLTGTITHTYDNVSELAFSNFPTIDSAYQIRPKGFLAFNVTPGAVVSPQLSGSFGYQFTGSVAVKCIAQVSNGVIAKFSRTMLNSNANLNRSGVLDTFNASEIALTDESTPNFYQTAHIAYINNFGRGGTGFEPSGRSVFGKEFAPSRSTINGKVPNPFYLSGGLGALNFEKLNAADIPEQFKNAAQNGSFFKAHAAIPLETCLPSPYLVLPGDKLILAVSKTRPFYYGTNTPTPQTSGSVTHDVQLTTGTINVTLYGSLLRENMEFHDTLNQSLASDAIHEIVIGNDPVLDQFEGAYIEQYVSGTYDDLTAGALLTKTKSASGKIVLTSGSRGRVFSKANARFAATPGTTENDSNDSVSFRLQPYYEKAGSTRHAQANDISERFWDSLMPAINECFLADGSGIYVRTPDSTISTTDAVDRNIGFIRFNALRTETLTDLIWPCAFPFEPRYAAVARQRDIAKSFLANYIMDSGGTVTQIQPKPVTGFLFGPRGTRFPSVPAITPASASIMSSSVYGVNDLYYVCDTFLNNRVTGNFSIVHPLTSSAVADDISRGIFGFGDLNNITFSNVVVDDDGLGMRVGTNHFADVRERHRDSVSAVQWSTSPLIRGWKYGVYSGLPAFSKAYFRQSRYGQLRDMLEQRLYTKFYQSRENNPNVGTFKQGTSTAAVTVKFIDASGKLTKPENTWSQNLSQEATSSVPYFDGETRNRPSINTDTLNANIITFKSNAADQITL